MNLSKTDFDPQFNAIKTLNKQALTWLPWVGGNYNNYAGNKLLIVGESHYCWQDSSKTLDEIKRDIGYSYHTRNMVHSSGLFGLGSKDGKKKPLHRLFRNTERVLFNKKKPSGENCKILWQSVSFYNFIQRPLDSQKHRPKQNGWQEGWKTFFKILDILQPDYVLFCGVSAFKNSFLDEAIKNSGYLYEKKIRNKDEKIKETFVKTKGIIAKEDHKIIISCIRHPSILPAWGEWSKIIYRQMPNYIDWLKAQTVKKHDNSISGVSL